MQSTIRHDASVPCSTSNINLLWIKFNRSLSVVFASPLYIHIATSSHSFHAFYVYYEYVCALCSRKKTRSGNKIIRLAAVILRMRLREMWHIQTTVGVDLGSCRHMYKIVADINKDFQKNCTTHNIVTTH